jgi:hypothetical protein
MEYIAICLCVLFRCVASVKVLNYERTGVHGGFVDASLFFSQNIG